VIACKARNISSDMSWATKMLTTRTLPTSKATSVASYGRLTDCLCIYLAGGCDGYAATTRVCSCRNTQQGLQNRPRAGKCNLGAIDVLFNVSRLLNASWGPQAPNGCCYTSLTGVLPPAVSILTHNTRDDASHGCRHVIRNCILRAR
jgi:hypothetical protein